MSLFHSLKKLAIINFTRLGKQNTPQMLILNRFFIQTKDQEL